MTPSRPPPIRQRTTISSSTETRLGLVRRRLLLARHLVPLGLDALLSPLARRLGLCALGVHLVLDLLLTLLLGLGLVDLQTMNLSS